MEVAEEKPPKKEKIARLSRPIAKGMLKTKKSGLEFSGIIFNPTTAIGTTNRDIKSK